MPEEAATEILWAALEKYRSPLGCEGDLIDAAGRLEKMGAAAFYAYEAVAPLPECEFFLAAMARAGAARAVALARQNRDANVRGRIRELEDEGALTCG